MGSITYQGLIERVENKTMSSATAYANWPTTRKLELVNDGVFETFKLLVTAMPWSFFVEVQDGIVPVSNTIALNGLLKPYYSLLAMSVYPYTEGCDVNVKTIRDVHSNRRNDQGWYEIGDVLKSDVTSALAGPYRVVYNYKPTRATSEQLGTFCEIPDEYIDMPPLWATMEAYSDAQYNENYMKLESQWERRAAKLMQDAARRNQTKQMRILDKMGWSRRGTIYLGGGA